MNSLFTIRFQLITQKPCFTPQAVAQAALFWIHVRKGLRVVYGQGLQGIECSLFGQSSGLLYGSFQCIALLSG
jgi:hypothetical protein